MPLRWEILHDKKLVYVTADGAVTLKDLEDHFDALYVESALPYGKLFDATRMAPIYNDDDVMAMGARLSAYTDAMQSGPLAMVGQDEFMSSVFRRFVNISPSRRPARVFKTVDDARAWLVSMADHVADQRTDEHL